VYNHTDKETTMTHQSRRDLLKALGTAPVFAASGVSPLLAQTTPPPLASAKPTFSIWSLTLQWTPDMDEACAVAAEAGYKSIAWTVRPGAHILAANVARDLPKAVDAAKKAGLATPMIVTQIVDSSTPLAEAVLDTMHGLGIRYYRCNTIGSYDYAKDLEPQLEHAKQRVASMVKLNEKYGTTGMYNNESSAKLIGGGIWDLWQAVKDLDPARVGICYNIAHATMRGGPEWWETIRFAHKHIAGFSLCDFKWVRKTDPVRGDRRTDADESWPWAAEWVKPGDGMVNFKAAFQSLRQIGFTGPIHVFNEYRVDVPGLPDQVNLLGKSTATTNTRGLEMPRDMFIGILRRDHEFYMKLMTDAQLL
jgi:L-ribulose-5-phosphate 3-epimerase